MEADIARERRELNQLKGIYNQQRQRGGGFSPSPSARQDVLDMIDMGTNSIQNSIQRGVQDTQNYINNLRRDFDANSQELERSVERNIFESFGRDYNVSPGLTPGTINVTPQFPSMNPAPSLSPGRYDLSPGVGGGVNIRPSFGGGFGL